MRRRCVLKKVPVHSKGRSSLPADIRPSLGIEEGDTPDNENAVIHIAKAINPLDALAGYAEQEYRAGCTRKLGRIARNRGIAPPMNQCPTP